MSQARDILSENMKALRSLKKWKQDDLAEASGLALDTVRGIESKRAWVSSDSLEALAGALGVHVGDLFKSTESHLTAPAKEPTLSTLFAISGALKIRASFIIEKMER